jgi:hypothetical protein
MRDVNYTYKKSGFSIYEYFIQWGCDLGIL